jgi:ADP-ribose pyrophosphatase YjhB (NUDIX family)
VIRNDKPALVHRLIGTRENGIVYSMKRVKREAVRALILTPEGEILLMRAEEPYSGRQVWFTPGGGIESGENPKTCLRRELDEETGVHNLQIGLPVWTRKATFDWAG